MCDVDVTGHSAKKKKKKNIKEGKWGDIEKCHQSCVCHSHGGDTKRTSHWERALKTLLKCILCWSGLKASSEGSEFLAWRPQRTLGSYRRLFVLSSFSAAATWLRQKEKKQLPNHTNQARLFICIRNGKYPYVCGIKCQPKLADWILNA